MYLRPSILCILMLFCLTSTRGQAGESADLVRELEQDLKLIKTQRDDLLAKAKALPVPPEQPMKLQLTLTEFLHEKGGYKNLSIILRRRGDGTWLAGSSDRHGSADEIDCRLLRVIRDDNQLRLEGSLRVLLTPNDPPLEQRIEAEVKIQALFGTQISGTWTTDGHAALPVLPRGDRSLSRIPARNGSLTGTWTRPKPELAEPLRQTAHEDAEIHSDEAQARWLATVACEQYRQSVAALMAVQQKIDLAHVLELLPIYRPRWDRVDKTQQVIKSSSKVSAEDLLEDGPVATKTVAQLDLASMKAILIQVRRIRQALEGAGTVTPCIPTPCADPDFGPWFGEDLLSIDDQGRHVLPAMPVAEGPQLWQRFDHWRFVGPFPYRVRPPHGTLPDLIPLTSTAKVQEDPQLVETIAGVCRERKEVDIDAEAVCSNNRRINWGWGSTLVPMGRDTYSHSSIGNCPALSVYAHAELVAPAAGLLWAGLNLPAGGALWVNDRLVWQDPGPEDPGEIERVHRLQLPVVAGPNRLLVRIDRRLGTAHFALRVCVRGAPRSGTPATRLAGQNATEGLRGWRGDWNGRQPQAQPPLAWDLREDHNVRWELPLGVSHANPVIVKDRVYVMEDPSTLVCVDAASGKLLWRKLFLPEHLDPKLTQKLKEIFATLEAPTREIQALGATTRQRQRAIASRQPDPEKAQAEWKEKLEAALKPVDSMRGLLKEAKIPGLGWWDWIGRSFPTPISDGRHLWFWANVGLVACCDLDGNPRWITSFPDTYGIPSPVLIGERLVICYFRSEKKLTGFAAGFDAQTGVRLWEVETGPPASGRGAYDEGTGSPVPLILGQGSATQAVVVTADGSVIRVLDGKVLRQHLGIRECYGTPITDGVASVFMSNMTNRACYELLLDEAGQLGARVRWHRQRFWTQYDEGNYQVRDERYLYQHCGRLDVYDGYTGVPVSSHPEVLWHSSGRPYVPPLLAGGHLYLGDLGNDTGMKKSSFRDGCLSVTTTGPIPLVLARNRIGQLNNSPIADGTSLYIRQWHSLLCLGSTGPAGERYAAETVAREVLSSLPPYPQPGAPLPRPALRPVDRCGVLVPTLVPNGWVTIGLVPEAETESVRRWLQSAPAKEFLHLQESRSLPQEGVVRTLIPVPNLATEEECDFANMHHITKYRTAFSAGQARGVALASPVWARNIVSGLSHAAPGKELVVNPGAVQPGSRLLLMVILTADMDRTLRWRSPGPGARAWLDSQELTPGQAVEWSRQQNRRLVLEIGPNPQETAYRPQFWYSQGETQDLADWKAAVSIRRPYLETLLQKAPHSPLFGEVTRILAAAKP